MRSRRDVRVVVGGYDPSLAPDAWTNPAIGVDAIVRGEGEVTFRDLVRALEARVPLGDVDGSVVPRWRRVSPQPAAARSPSIENGTCGRRNRAARVLAGYTMLGRQVDVVETSRGCTFDCSFCSIIEMRGRNFHRFPIPRVIDDIARRAAPRRACHLPRRRQHHARRRAVQALCDAIVEAGLNDIDYIVQGMTSADRRARRRRSRR